MMSKSLWLGLGLLVAANSTYADIKTQTVEYSANATSMHGFMAYDDKNKTPMPGILIVHDWMGLGDFTKNKAKELAAQGYVALAVDIYGNGMRPKDTQEAGQLVKKYKGDRKLLRERIQAAYDKLISMKEVNPKKILVMGYCFGGTTALELARNGAPLVGTVSFHGGLSSPTPADAKNIVGEVLVLHGADDPTIPPQEVAAFKEEMKNANVKMTFIEYPGAVHAFTNPEAGNDNSKGMAYNAKADKASWAEFEKFLKRVDAP